MLLVRELLAGAELQEDGVARRLFGDLAYRSEALGEELAEREVLLRAERAGRRPAIRQQVEVCFAVLKRALGMFGMGETSATTLVGLVTSVVAAKVSAYTYGLSTSTGCLGDRRAASKSRGHEIPATLI